MEFPNRNFCRSGLQSLAPLITSGSSGEWTIHFATFSSSAPYKNPWQCRSLLWILSRGRPWDANFKYYDDSVMSHCFVIFVQAQWFANHVIRFCCVKSYIYCVLGFSADQHLRLFELVLRYSKVKINLLEIMLITQMMTKLVLITWSSWLDYASWSCFFSKIKIDFRCFFSLRF